MNTIPKPSIDQLIATVKKFNHALFEGSGKSGNYRDYDLNIIGIRSDNIKSNLFDDTYCILYRLDKKWQVHYLQCTTDPGAWELMRPSFPEAQKNGTGILKHDEQYRGAYKLGFHGGGAWRHVALQQVGIVKAYRDNNRDDVLDMNPKTVMSGYFGANHHAANLYRQVLTVDNWSAMCQVIVNPEEHRLAAELWTRSAKIWGDIFSYSLYHINSLAT